MPSLDSLVSWKIYSKKQMLNAHNGCEGVRGGMAIELYAVFIADSISFVITSRDEPMVFVI